jgi:hypothetical protein
MVLADNGPNHTPLFCATDCTVTEGSGSANHTVGADHGLLWLNHDWFFVPHKWFFQYFKDLLVDYGRFDTADAPLVFRN